MLTWIIIALKVWSHWKNILCIHCAVWSTALTGAKQAAFFRSAWQIHMSEIYTGASRETLNRMESYQKTLEVQALTVFAWIHIASRSLFRARLCGAVYAFSRRTPLSISDKLHATPVFILPVRLKRNGSFINIRVSYCCAFLALIYLYNWSLNQSQIMVFWSMNHEFELHKLYVTSISRFNLSLNWVCLRDEAFLACFSLVWDQICWFTVSTQTHEADLMSSQHIYNTRATRFSL